MNLFTYGSLMVPEIMTKVTGCTLQAVEVTLEGYERYGVRNEQYPGVVEKVGGRVDGILYLDVPPEAVTRLDLFEGQMYSREAVHVLRRDGRGRVAAMAYLVKPAFSHLLTGESWDLRHFLEHGRALFESRYVGFDELNGG